MLHVHVMESTSEHPGLFIFFVFQSVINRVNISGNIDNPEGTLDALMQIAVCDKVRMFVLYQVLWCQSHNFMTLTLSLLHCCKCWSHLNPSKKLMPNVYLPLVIVQMKISLLVSWNRYICVSFATCINFFLCQDVWLFSIKLILVKTSLWLLFVFYVSFAIKDNHQLSSLMSCQCYDSYLLVEKIRAWKISFNNRKLDGETSSLREELSLL